MKTNPSRPYSKTDLRRGTVMLTHRTAHQPQVAADEQAALFGEAQGQQIPHADAADRGPESDDGQRSPV